MKSAVNTVRHFIRAISSGEQKRIDEVIYEYRSTAESFFVLCLFIFLTYMIAGDGLQGLTVTALLLGFIVYITTAVIVPIDFLTDQETGEFSTIEYIFLLVKKLVILALLISLICLLFSPIVSQFQYGFVELFSGTLTGVEEVIRCLYTYIIEPALLLVIEILLLSMLKLMEFLFLGVSGARRYNDTKIKGILVPMIVMTVIILICGCLLSGLQDGVMLITGETLAAWYASVSTSYFTALMIMIVMMLVVAVDWAKLIFRKKKELPESEEPNDEDEEL